MAFTILGGYFFKKIKTAKNGRQGALLVFFQHVVIVGHISLYINATLHWLQIWSFGCKKGQSLKPAYFSNFA